MSGFHHQPHKRNHMWIWEHANMKSKARIDHIQMRKKWVNSLKKCRACSSVEIDSDHPIVTVNIFLCFPRSLLFFELLNYNNTQLKLVIDSLLLMIMSILRPFKMKMTILSKSWTTPIDLLFLKKDAREKNGLAKTMTISCLKKKKPKESLEITEMIINTYLS